jgi:hypothetical protein
MLDSLSLSNSSSVKQQLLQALQAPQQAAVGIMMILILVMMTLT